MSAIAKIEQGLIELGYDAGALHRAYSFADVLDTAAQTRTVALAAFTQTPESFRSAAFGVVEDEPDSAAAVMASRALGAPIFFSIDNDSVGVWSVGARQAPRLLERVPVDQLGDLFDRHRDSWTPQALHRAKALGLPRVPIKVDFVDLGFGLPVPTVFQHVAKIGGRSQIPGEGADTRKVRVSRIVPGGHATVADET